MQHDQNIANDTGAAVRADINVALTALFSNSSGAAAPATTVAYQLWADTTTGLLKMRNAANSAWVTIGTMASPYLGLQGGPASLTTGDFSSTVSILTSVAEGGTLMALSGANAGAGRHFFLSCDASGYNTANAGVWVGKDTASGRSINAGGTINASGADYAEYERKAPISGTIVKGQIIGFDAEGRITDKWAEALSFGVKSTDPVIVGGDSWGTPEALGMARPAEPLKRTAPDYEEELATYQKQKAVFDALLDVARQRVDRIAYSGKVPVNVLGAAVGDYIVPAQDGDGITGVAVAADAITFAQHRIAVGQVRRILVDGRAEIAVKVA